MGRLTPTTSELGRQTLISVHARLTDAFANYLRLPSRYGENVNLTVQNVIIIALMWRYTKASGAHMLGATAVFLAFWVWSFSLPVDCGPVEACMAAGELAQCWALRPCQNLLIRLPVPLILMARVPQVAWQKKAGRSMSPAPSL